VTRYRIVAERSRLLVDGRSSVHPLHLTGTGVEGRLDLEPTEDGVDLTAPVDARLSMAVARLRSGNAFEERELRRRIDARRFPSIDATLTALRTGGAPGRYRASGDLTFHGVTRTQEGEVLVERLDDTSVRAEGRTTVDVRSYGIVPPRLFGLRVEALVEVRLELLAVEDV
jgi:polyisoprenoid-binding protein YceI